MYLILEYSKEEEGEGEQEENEKEKEGKSVKFKLRSRDSSEVEEENDKGDVYYVDARVTDEKVGEGLLKLAYEGEFAFFKDSLEYDLEILKEYPEAEAEFSVRHVNSVIIKRYSLKNGKIVVL